MLEIDMIVTLPGSILEEKDYLNLRYFYKRAYYLGCIAAGLKTSIGKEYSIRFKLFHDNALHPIVTVEPTQKNTEAVDERPQPKWCINVIPCLGENQFSSDKLRPKKNCVRSQIVAKLLSV